MRERRRIGQRARERGVKRGANGGGGPTASEDAIATVMQSRGLSSIVTQWVEEPSGGRDRGPVALLRAWVEVLLRPHQFFRAGVAPGDQGPGLVFVATVVLIEEGTRLALVEDAAPVVAGRPLASRVLVLALVVVLVAPLVLHLIAAIQTLLLIPFVSDRAGISETVQAIAYATAPCVLAGVPISALRVTCGAYGAVLLAIGISRVHGTSLARAATVSAIPSALVFGYGFRGFAAAAALFGTDVSLVGTVL